MESQEVPQMRANPDDPRNYAYQKVLGRLNEYFPVEEYVNKVIPREDLVELGLITGEGLDRTLLEDYNQTVEKPGPALAIKERSRPII